MLETINCLIIDDDELVADILKSYIQKLGHWKLVGVSVNPLQAREKLLQQPVDVLFLDVELPGLSGIDLLKSLSFRPLVVLISGNKDYAVEGFNLDVQDFILKPITFERFLKSINKIEAMLSTPNEVEKVDIIHVTENKKTIKVNVNDIYFIESLKDYSRIVLSDRQIVTHQPISYFEKTLDPKRFMRVHRCVIVSLAKVQAFSATTLDLGIADVPLGGTYKKEVLEVLNNRFLK
ncbi:MAG TPA: LytTR family DNA-binding domain-containing protein [Salinivirgaceae bacterium]|nr:LytTR family DNA-binding domain-containing protein [Salinivirgaceae bacterium]